MRAQIVSAILFIVLLCLIITVVFVLIASRRKAKIAEAVHISWSEAVIILYSGQVKLVSQTHQRDVTLVLDNGQVLQTTEPYIDDIFREVTKCGTRCAGMSLATE